MHSQIPSCQTHSLCLSLHPLPPPQCVQNPVPLISFTDFASRQTHATRCLQTPGLMKNHREESSLARGDFWSHTERRGKKSSVPSRACVLAAVHIWITSACLMPHQVYRSPFCVDITIYFGLWKHEMQSTRTPHGVCELQIPGVLRQRPCHAGTAGTSGGCWQFLESLAEVFMCNSPLANPPWWHFHYQVWHDSERDIFFCFSTTQTPHTLTAAVGRPDHSFLRVSEQTDWGESLGKSQRGEFCTKLHASKMQLSLLMKLRDQRWHPTAFERCLDNCTGLQHVFCCLFFFF